MKKTKHHKRVILYEKKLTEILVKSLSINFEIRCQSWVDLVPNSQELCYRATTAALKAAGVTGDGAEIGVILANDSFVQSLHRQWLDKDKPTNVLAFPSEDFHKNRGPLNLLGDIVVAAGVVKEEALEQNKSITNHLAHMIVHGTLHLLGYDHVSDKAAAKMENLETNALAGLSIKDPYFSN